MFWTVVLSTFFMYISIIERRRARTSLSKRSIYLRCSAGLSKMEFGLDRIVTTWYLENLNEIETLAIILMQMAGPNRLVTLNCEVQKDWLRHLPFILHLALATWLERQSQRWMWTAIMADNQLKRCSENWIFIVHRTCFQKKAYANLLCDMDLYQIMILTTLSSAISIMASSKRHVSWTTNGGSNSMPSRIFSWCCQCF